MGSDVCAEGKDVNSPLTRGPKRDFVPLDCTRTRCMAGNPFERERERRKEGIIIVGSNGQIPTESAGRPRPPVGSGAAAPAGPGSHTFRRVGSASSADCASRVPSASLHRMGS